MGTYTGWKHDLLSSDGMPDTAANLRFMDDWHDNSESDCANNPVDLTRPIKSGSSNCKPTGYVGRSYQRYTDRMWTRTAFAAQMKSGSYPHLRAALKSGNPYTVNNYQAVAEDLGRWASNAFPNVYVYDALANRPAPSLKAPQALRGWKDLQHSVNHKMPAALRASAHYRHAALRQLRKARKVKL